jgi:CRP-like cAMP-binding protein
MAEASDAEKNETSETKPPEPGPGLAITDVLDWALKLSAEERGWIDSTYQPPQEIVDLAARLSRTSRSFYVLSGLWGVGKSSALQYLSDRLEEAHRKSYLLRVAPDRSILNQLVAENVRNQTEYISDLSGYLKRRRGEAQADRFQRAYNALTLQGGLAEVEEAIPKTKLHRIRQESAIEELGSADALFLDLPDFSRSDRRPLIRTLNQVQCLWLMLMQEGAAYSDEPLGPNIVMALQKELFDLAPSYFLGKANITELKPLTADQIIYAFEEKFPMHDDLIDLFSLDYLAHLSRGVFRRFLKFLAVVLEDAERRKLSRITLSEAMAAVSPAQVSQEMEAELACIFPQPHSREKAAKIIMMFLQRKYEPSRLEQAFDPNLAKPPEITQKQIAETLSLTEVEVSRLLDRLEKNGLINRDSTTYVDQDGNLRTKRRLSLNM